MELILKGSEIISASEITKNFAACREQVKKNSRAIIFKNNKPDLAILNIEEYQNIMAKEQHLREENERLNDLLENLAILQMVQERDQRDTGKRYSLDDLEIMINNQD